MPTSSATTDLTSWTVNWKVAQETPEQRLRREYAELKASIAARQQWMEDQRSKFNYKKISQFGEAKTLHEGLIETYMMLMRYTDPRPREWWQWQDRPYIVGQPGHNNHLYGDLDHRRLTLKPKPEQCRKDVSQFVEGRSIFMLDGGELREHQMRAIRKIFRQFAIVQIPVTKLSEMALFQITTHQTESRGNMTPWRLGIWRRPTIFFTYFNLHQTYQFVISACTQDQLEANCWAFEACKEMEFEEAKAQRKLTS